jgi:hypothetical protein
MRDITSKGVKPDEKLVKVVSMVVILILLSSIGAAAWTEPKMPASKEDLAKQNNAPEEYGIYNFFNSSKSNFKDILEYKKSVQELFNSIGNLYKLTDELEEAFLEADAPKNLILKHKNAKSVVLRSHAKVRHSLDNTTILLKELVANGEISEEILNRHLNFIEEFESKSQKFLHTIEQYTPILSTATETRITTPSINEIEELKRVLEDATHPPENDLPIGLLHEPVSLTAPKPKVLGETGKIVKTLTFTPSHDPSDYLYVNASNEIRKLATDLDHDPVQIYYYMRNNIDYEPYYGLMAGSEWTLQQQGGNSFDQANLFVALLRESEIPARYVYGTIEVPAENATKWLRVKNCAQASVLLNRSGIPSTYIEENNSLRLEHLWVEAYIEQNNSEMWLPLDPSFKTYEYVPGLNLTYTNVTDFLNETLETATYDEEFGWLTGVNETFIREKFESWTNETLEYIMNDSDLRNRSLTQLFGYWDLTKKYSDSLSSTLPYGVISVLNVYSEVPQEYHHKIELKGLVNYTLYTPDIGNKKIMLKFNPATDLDYKSLNIFGWTDMVEMRPILVIDGKQVANGSARGLGSRANLRLEFYYPMNTTPEIVNDTFIVGSLYSILFNMGKVSLTQVEKEAEELDLPRNETFADNALRQLHLVGMYWLSEKNLFENIYASAYDVRDYRPAPSYLTTSLDLKVWYLFGISMIDEGEMYIDVKRDILEAIGEDNDTKSFMFATLMVGSALEHSIFEQLYGIESVSTIKVLQEANKQRIPIYTISKHNVDNLRLKLDISSDDLESIEEAVNNDRIVIIPESELQINEWEGIGYIDFDPSTGRAAFMIRGSAGGMPTELPGWSLMLVPSISLNSRIAKEVLQHFKLLSSSIQKYYKDLNHGMLLEFGSIIHLTGCNVLSPIWSFSKLVLKGENALNVISITCSVVIFACGATSGLGTFTYYISVGVFVVRLISKLVGLFRVELFKDQLFDSTVNLRDYGIYPNVYENIRLDLGYDVIILSKHLAELKNITGISNLIGDLANGCIEAVFEAEIAAEYKKEDYDIIELEKKIPKAEIDILIMNPDKTYKIIEAEDINDWSIFELEEKREEFEHNISDKINAFKNEYGEDVEIIFVFDGKIPQWVRDYVCPFSGNISIVESYGGASGVTLYVDGTKSMITHSNDKNVYNTIQAAVDAASHGDSIYVYSGTYKENVILDKPLALISENRDTTIMDGDGSGDAIKVISDDCVISGFTVANGSNGIYVASDNNIITQNSITNMVGADGDLFISLSKKGEVGTGVYLFTGVNNLISNNSISDILGGDGGSANDWLSTDGTGDSGIGIYLHSSASNTLSNNTISGINGGTGGGDDDDGGRHPPRVFEQ